MWAGENKTAPGWTEAVRQQCIDTFNTAAARYGEEHEEYEELKRKYQALVKETRALEELERAASGSRCQASVERKVTTASVSAGLATTSSEVAAERGGATRPAGSDPLDSTDAHSSSELPAIRVRGRVASDGVVATQCQAALVAHLVATSAAITRVRLELVPTGASPAATTMPTTTATAAAATAVSIAEVGAVALVAAAAIASEAQLRVLIVSDEGDSVEDQRKRVADPGRDAPASWTGLLFALATAPSSCMRTATISSHSGTCGSKSSSTSTIRSD